MVRSHTVIIGALVSLVSLQLYAVEPATLKAVEDLPAEAAREISPPPTALPDPATYFKETEPAPAAAKSTKKSLAEEEAEAIAKETAKARAREEADARSKIETKAPVVTEEPKAAPPPKEMKKSLAEEEAEALAKAQADARAKAEADARAKAEADARAKAEADARAKAEADARAKAEADARAKAEADARAKAEALAREKQKPTPGDSDSKKAKRTAPAPSKPATQPVAETPTAPLTGTDTSPLSSVPSNPIGATAPNMATGSEAQRLARAMLADFKAECGPLATAKKESSMFGMFSSDDNPLVGKCLEDLGVFVNSFWATAETAEALNLMATLHRARKDTVNETRVLAQLVYLHNDSPQAATASSRLLGLALEELKVERQTLKTLAKGSAAPEVADRYLQFIKDFSKLETGTFLKLLRQQSDDFLFRFPGHSGAEHVLFLREESFNREKRFDLAAAGLRRVIAVYPDSPQRPGRLLALGGIYDEQLKQYDQAVATYEQLYTAYSDKPEALGAYQRAARIYDEKLEKYPQAVALLDRIVSKYPKEEPARQALEYAATIYTLKIRNYYSAIKTYQRLADMFKGDAALQALVKAAELARTPVEDYELQIELQARIVSEYPESSAASQALFDSAETYAERLKNPKQAIATYQQLIDKYPAGKLTEKAKANLAKLTGTK